MNFSDLEYLKSEQAREQISQHLGSDVIAIAMNKNIANASVIATQVKYLQRSRTKLPSYYHAKCIIPHLGFEQCSSELCASEKKLTGDLCIDLTCGLGVDSYYLSKGFKRVISLERDPLMAEVARVNFGRLGADNIEVICSSAEDFIRDCTLKADLIYADPDRRDAEGKKQVLLEDCSPNMLELDQCLRQISDNIVIKCSPLFDVDEAFRLYDKGSQVEVLSLAGECKEVVIYSLKSSSKSEIKVNAVGKEVLHFDYPSDKNFDEVEFIAEDYRYVILPDVALVKSRCARDYYSQWGDMFLQDNNSVVFCKTAPTNSYGTVFEIETTEKFNPKKLKKELKTQGIKKATIYKKNFVLSTEQIVSGLGIKQGGETKFLFSEVQKTKYAIKIK